MECEIAMQYTAGYTENVRQKVRTFMEGIGTDEFSYRDAMTWIRSNECERIQDGVERITFASGFPAIQFTQELNTHLSKSSKILNVPKEKIIEGQL